MTVTMLNTIEIAYVISFWAVATDGFLADLPSALQAAAANGAPEEGAANGAAETNGEKR